LFSLFWRHFDSFQNCKSMDFVRQYLKIFLSTDRFVPSRTVS
jgi:hypothetical protein